MDNDKGNICGLFRLEDCVFLSILKTCGLIHQKKVNEKMLISIEKDQWKNLRVNMNWVMLILLYLISALSLIINW